MSMIKLFTYFYAFLLLVIFLGLPSLAHAQAEQAETQQSQTFKAESSQEDLSCFPAASGCIKEGDAIVCSWHRSVFDLKTGACREGPCFGTGAHLRKYEAWVERENIFVRL